MDTSALTPAGGDHAPGGGVRGAETRRLFLVDGSGLVFRAHFAFARRPLTNSRGLQVGAIFGFASTLLALIRDEDARYLAVAFDTPAPTFRHARYPAYKANRPEMPPELAAQFPHVRELVAAMGLAGISVDGIEADDVIGSLARQGRAEGWEVVIVSADKDFAQLITSGVRQYVPSRGGEPERWIEAAEITQRWGVRPEQFVDFLALSGDASDNIPGVAGIGPKTAARLLQHHDTLDEIYGRLEEIDPVAVRAKLAAGRENAFLSRELVRIATDRFTASLAQLAVPDPSRREELRVLLDALELRQVSQRLFGRPPGATPAVSGPASAKGVALQGSLLDAAAGPQPAHPPVAPGGAAAGVATPITVADGWDRSYRMVTDEHALERALAARGRESAPLAIDTETSSLDPRQADLVGLSFAWQSGEAWYVPIGHRDARNVPLGAVQRLLGPILADREVVKLGQHLGFDLHVLERHGLGVRGPLRDTMIASYLRDPEARHGLDDLSREFLGHGKVPIEELIGRGRAKISMAEVPPERVAPYACEDADAVVRLWPPLRARLEEIGAERLFADLEMPLVPVLVAMERAGISVDVAFLSALAAGLRADLRRAAEEIQRLAGEEFNVNSTRQLGAVLFDRLKLGPRRRTKTGFSTRQEVLEELAAEHPLPQAVLDYRLLAKLQSTYVEALPRMVDPASGRVHARFHQAVTATGRLSSSDPNLQNIPIRTTRGREIRRAFVAAPGFVLLAADYSQIELRILAHLSEDEHLCAAFRRGEDVHRATAARVFGVAPEAVDAEMRARAKTVNFGILYGMGAPRLARELRIPLAEAGRFISEYYARLPRTRAYMERSLREARSRGYVETILGRRRLLPDLEAAQGRERAAAERMAANTPIQGSAADLIKLAMVRLHELLAREHPRARLLLQVHDELLFEVPASEADAVASVVRREMEGAWDLRVPLVVATGRGANWYDAHA